MEIINKYPKLFQWILLLIVFFGLCFAIDVPEGYKFIRAQAEHIKVAGQSQYNFIGITVTYLEFNFLWSSFDDVVYRNTFFLSGKQYLKHS